MVRRRAVVAELNGDEPVCWKNPQDSMMDGMWPAEGKASVHPGSWSELLLR